ncbi:MAG: FkbM family methyltransferase [Kiritimatiellae bacterium]|nr:FkbM family methyltransferase [Kiritimatiellia bacterium]
MTKETHDRMIHCITHPAETIHRLLHLLERNAFNTQVPNVRDYALTLPDRMYERYKSELDYLATAPYDEADNPVRGMFPYPQTKPSKPVESGRDGGCGLPYAVHNGKRLYFPKHFTPEQAAETYRSYIEIEGIVGEGHLAKSPHRYHSGTHRVEPGDVVVDVGCSEGLFALDTVETAKRCYLFESEPVWQRPLRETFKPYAEKVTIVNRFVGDGSGGSVRLDEILGKDTAETFFIKMDIEGNERTVLAASRDFLTANRVKLSCCVYHRQDDEAFITAFLKAAGFEVAFSEGYMLPAINGIHFPFFRRGVAYARCPLSPERSHIAKG